MFKIGEEETEEDEEETEEEEEVTEEEVTEEEGEKEEGAAANEFDCILLVEYNDRKKAATAVAGIVLVTRNIISMSVVY